MSTFKSIARLALAVVFGAGGVLAAHTAFDGREMPLPDHTLADNLRRRTNNERQMLPGPTMHGICLRI
jgi:hypothetical protein